MKARPWCGRGPPDVSVIPPIPDHHQDLEEWMNSRNSECETHSSLVHQKSLHACVAQGASRMASMRKGAAAQELVAMDLQNGPGTRMSVLIDGAAQMFGWGARSSWVPLRVRCRWCQAKYGSHSGPVDTKLDTVEERGTPPSTVPASPHRRAVPMAESFGMESLWCRLVRLMHHRRGQHLQVN